MTVWAQHLTKTDQNLDVKLKQSFVQHAKSIFCWSWRAKRTSVVDVACSSDARSVPELGTLLGTPLGRLGSGKGKQAE